jgi:hypothetical protein
LAGLFSNADRDGTASAAGNWRCIGARHAVEKQLLPIRRHHSLANLPLVRNNGPTQLVKSR